MKKLVTITETYTYDLEIEINENETIDEVIHEYENIRNMSDELFDEISSKDSFQASLEYEY